MLAATKKTSNTNSTLRRSSTVTPGHNAYKKLLLLLISAGLTLLTTARAKPTLSFQLPTSLTIPSFSTSFSQYVERKQAEKMKTFRWVWWWWLQGLISRAQFPCHANTRFLSLQWQATGWTLIADDLLPRSDHCDCWIGTTQAAHRLWIDWDLVSCISWMCSPF